MDSFINWLDEKIAEYDQKALALKDTAKDSAQRYVVRAVELRGVKVQYTEMLSGYKKPIKN